MISKYEEKILNHLLDKYEKSKSFIGENKVNQKFTVKIATLFPKYEDHGNFEIFREINEAIDILNSKQLIYAKINKAHVCSEVVLNLDKVQQAYEYLQRTDKKHISKELIRILDEFKGENEILESFCKEQIERIKTNKTVKFFGGDIKEFRNILTAVSYLPKVQIETFDREFSVKIFKDSKLFKDLSGKIVNLLYDHGDFPEKDYILESLNIVKNPTYVNFKGAGEILLKGQKLNLSLLKADVGISSIMLKDIESIKITGKIVMTIENLTNFHTAQSKDIFFIYLGGFHNEIRRDFIQKIHQQNPDTKFYHFGDIDAGGFYILEHLRRLTKVDFIPYKMDLATLKKYKNYAKELTQNDRRRLKNLRESVNNEIIDYMLEHNVKLEQEAVEFEDDL